MNITLKRTGIYCFLGKMVAMLLIATICLNAYDDVLIEHEQIHASEVVVAAFGDSNDMDHEEQEESTDDTAHKTRRIKSVCDKATCTLQTPVILTNSFNAKRLSVTSSHATRALRTLHCTYRI